MAHIDWLAARASLLFVVCLAASATAQAPPQGPPVVSPEVAADRRIVLRVLAQQAQVFRKHGFSPVYTESGGRTWLNRRDCLNAFAPQLFQ